MKEEFKDIPGYEGRYQVSDLGNVKSMNFNHTNIPRLMKQSMRKGYLRVSIHKNKKAKDYNVHKLVAMTFLGHITKNKDKVVHHINNDPLDNRAVNLRIVTRRENTYTHYIGTSKYKGVAWSKTAKKWRSMICINNKQIHLGTYDNEIEASNAYQNAIPLQH